MNENICLFVPYHKDYHSIHTINFVLETKKQIYSSLKNESVYKMYYVTSGKGFLHTVGRVYPLSRGDIFFTFPSQPFAIESGENFTYMYISFVGSRGNMIMEKLNISARHFLFNGYTKVEDFWKKGLSTTSPMTDLISESVLLYTFSVLGEKLLSSPDKYNEKNTTALMIKKYIDDNFSDTDFSVDKISKELSYNKKYISSVFKKEFDIGIIDYLTIVRIQNACTMIQQGFTSVNDIALRCGYSDAQYFSRVFKNKMSLSPMQYMKAGRSF